MYDKNIAELSQALQKKTISSVELKPLFLDRIKQYNTTLNSFISN